MRFIVGFAFLLEPSLFILAERLKLKDMLILKMVPIFDNDRNGLEPRSVYIPPLLLTRLEQ